MPSFEKICGAVLEDPQFLRKWLIGGLLSYLPFVNLLVLGYVYRYTRQIREEGDVTLPEWSDLKGLVQDGLKMLLLVLIYVGLPLLAAGFVFYTSQGFFSLVHAHLFAETLAFIPLSIAALACPLLLACGLFHFQGREELQVLRFLHLTLRPLLRAGPQVVFPVFAVWGLALLGWPLIGFAIFLGFNLLMAYLTLAFQRVSQRC